MALCMSLFSKHELNKSLTALRPNGLSVNKPLISLTLIAILGVLSIPTSRFEFTSEPDPDLGSEFKFKYGSDPEVIPDPLPDPDPDPEPKTA
eukprot:631350_1